MAGDFWTSDEGILIRLEDLAHDIAFKTYNNAMKGAFKESGIRELIWTSVMDRTVCTYCEYQNGRRYNVGQFLPKLPAHIKCRCGWDARVKEGEV